MSKMTTKKNIFIAILTGIAVAILFWGILFTALVIFILTITVVMSLGIYVFIRGVVLSAVSSHLLNYYQFRSQVLDNKTPIPQIDFITSQLNDIELQMEEANNKEAQLKSSEEQQENTTLSI